MALTGACTGTPRRQRFRRYDASLLPVFALSGAIPNAACQASSKARPYAAYRRLQWVFRVRRHFRRYSSYSPVLAFCQAQSQMWLAKFLPRCGHIPFAGVCTGIPRPAAFSSAQRAAFPSFSCSRQNAISRGPPLFPHCSSMARVGGRMFYESTQKCRWFRHAATIPAKGHLRVISNLGSAEMALAKALPDADGRCGK